MHYLISGAGIGGPTFAWWASKTGSKVTIVEKASSLLSIGQNTDCHGSALKVLKKMDLLEAVKKLHTNEKGTQLVNAEGGVVAAFPIGPADEAQISGTSEYEILRGDLSKLLYESTKDLPNVEYRFSTTVDEVVSNDQDSVKVKFSDGQVESFDVLIAADGQWSKVRKLCFNSQDIEIKDFNLILSYWTAPRTAKDNDLWNVFLGLGRRVVNIRPDPYGSIRVMMNRMPENESSKEVWRKASRQDKATQKALVKKEFADLGWEANRVLESLDDAEDFYFQNIQQIRMKKWSIGRVVCIGDAAHAPTPLTAMGASLAITGPYILAQELNKLKDGESPSVAFEEYERLFKPFVQEVQYVPWPLPGFFHPNTAIHRWILWRLSTFIKLVIKLVASTSWYRKRALKPENEADFALPDYENETIESEKNKV